MDIADEETPSQVEPQPEEVPELHKVENEEVAAEQPCLDKKPPVAEAAPGPASEMDEDLKDGDAVPVLDEEVPDSGEAEAGPETPAEIKYPQHEAPPVDEPSHGDEVPVTSLPESETFPEMENTTAEEEVSGESVAPALEPELEDTTDIPHSSFEETSEPVEEGEEVHQPSVEHETVRKVEHGKITYTYKLN